MKFLVLSACVAISCGQLSSWHDLASGVTGNAAGRRSPAARPAQPVAAYVQNGLVEHPNGAVVPAEPAEVVTAKREHLQLASVPIAYILEDNLFVYPNGVIVPAEGEANMAARRAHLAALANA